MWESLAAFFGGGASSPTASALVGPAGKTMGPDAMQGPASETDPTSLMDILARANEPGSGKTTPQNSYATMFAQAPKPDVMSQGQILSLLNAHPKAPAYNKLPTRNITSLLGY